MIKTQEKKQDKVKTKLTPKKVLSIMGDVFLSLFLVFAVLCCVSVVLMKQSGNNSLNLFGQEMRLVLTESMEENKLTDVSSYEIKSIPKDSLIGIQTFKEDERQEFYDSLKVGDVLTFKYLITSSEQVVITHRIIEIEKKSDDLNYLITLRGDNINEDGTTSTQVIDTTYDESSFNYIIGKVTWVNPVLGYMMTFLKSTYGIVFIIILPSSFVVIFEIFKIISYYTSDKKAEKKAKDDEIKALKERLEQLEKANDHEEKGGTNN